jgi:serine/threonine protein kinase
MSDNSKDKYDDPTVMTDHEPTIKIDGDDPTIIIDNGLVEKSDDATQIIDYDVTQIVDDDATVITKEIKAPSQPGSHDEMVGKVLDQKYKILRRIGAGNMGVVYEARHQELEKSFAVKSILPEYTKNPEAQANLKKEPKVQGKLKHPNIIPVTDACFDDQGRFYFVMEYEDGKDLLDILKKKDVSEDEALSLIKDVLKALEHAHSKGIVHRDIKPKNIMVTGDNTARLTDFGIAMLITETAEDGDPVFAGTLSYASPEQLDNASAVDHRSDIYSVGIVLYQLLTHISPFKGATAKETIQNIRTAPVPDINTVLPNSFSELSCIINRALEKKPENRFQNCRDFIDAIDVYHRKTHIECRNCKFVNRVEDKYNLKNERCEKCGKKLLSKKIPKILAAALVASIVIILAYFFYPWPGKLSITTTPDQSMVYINGEKYRKSPFDVSLPPGEYKIRVEKDDTYEIALRTVTLVKRDTTELVVELPEKDVAYKKCYNTFKHAWRTAGDICMRFAEIATSSVRLERAKKYGISSQVTGFSNQIQGYKEAIDRLWMEYVDDFNELKNIQPKIRKTSYEMLAKDMKDKGDLNGLLTVEKHFHAYLSGGLDLTDKETQKEIMTFCEFNN